MLFVTGGGSGLGEATARRFAAEGGRVAVADLVGERAEKVASELDGCIGVQCDVSDETSVEAALRIAKGELGLVDAVFNAGGHAEFAPLVEWTIENWTKMLAVHAGGTFLVCKHVLPQMREKGQGAIVNVASVCAIVAQKNNLAYGAAKGAVVSFTRQLALDCAPEVRANVIAPGRIKSGMTEPLMRDRGQGDLSKGAALMGAKNLQGRMGEADEIAAPACFLLSDEASFITGAVLVADAGETII